MQISCWGKIFIGLISAIVYNTTEIALKLLNISLHPPILKGKIKDEWRKDPFTAARLLDADPNTIAALYISLYM